MVKVITRLRRIGVLLLIGFLIIIYFALGFLYIQQGTKQRGLEQEMTRLNLVIARPLPGAEKLQAEYDKVNLLLSPMPVEVILDILVKLASESGIDVNPDSNKFRITPHSSRKEKVGTESYQVLSFRNISAQGSYDNVMAFVSALDSGKALKTLVLKKVTINRIEIKGKGEEVKIETAAILDVDLYAKDVGQ